MLIKIIALIFTSILYLFFGFIGSVLLYNIDTYIYESEYDYKSNTTVIVEVSIMFILLVLFQSFITHVINQIQFPLDGYYGYKHTNISSGVGMIASMMMIVTSRQVQKIKRFYRIVNYNNI